MKTLDNHEKNENKRNEADDEEDRLFAQARVINDDLYRTIISAAKILTTIRDEMTY